MRRARRVYSAHYGAAREVGPWTWRGFSCGASYFCLWRLALFVVVLLVMDLSRLRMQPDFEIEVGGRGGSCARAAFVHYQKGTIFYSATHPKSGK